MARGSATTKMPRRLFLAVSTPEKSRATGSSTFSMEITTSGTLKPIKSRGGESTDGTLNSPTFMRASSKTGEDTAVALSGGAKTAAGTRGTSIRAARAGMGLCFGRVRFGNTRESGWMECMKGKVTSTSRVGRCMWEDSRAIDLKEKVGSIRVIRAWFKEYGGITSWW